MSMNTRWIRALKGAGQGMLAALPVVCALLQVQPAQATDTEVFFSNVGTNTGKPNVLFILDTSQSMYNVESALPAAPYVPGDIYAGACAPTAYYWATTGGQTPDCGASYAPLTALQFNCPSWRAQVDNNGFLTQSAKIQMHNGVNKWIDPVQQSRTTVCEVGGNNDYTTPLPPATPGLNFNGVKIGSYTFYRGNYLNYLMAAGGASKYRIDIVRETVAKLVQNTNGVRIGLMRYGYEGSRVLAKNTETECLDEWNPDESTRSGNGAPIVYPITDVEAPGLPTYHVGLTVRDQIRYELGVNAAGQVMSYTVNPSVPNALQPQRVVSSVSSCPIPLFVPGGRSPIAMAMYEAYLYYSGKQWSNKGGATVNLGSTYAYPSVETSRTGNVYNSPITESCGKNYIILLSDGTTEQDNDQDGPIQGLPGFQSVTGSSKCDIDPYLQGISTPPPSMCVDDMAEYMFETDMRASVAGLNNVITYTVGFKLGNDAFSNSGRQLLQETANRGGGQFYEAADAQKLEEILTEVLRQVLTDNATFSAPAVTVNAFNRTQNLNELYMSLFRPAFNYRWKGNIKKYRIESDGDIVDASSPPQPAVDPSTGFFRTTARSFWGSGTDGADITLGGAASQINPLTRKVYSNLTGNSNVNLSNASNAVSAIKSMPDATARPLLGLGLLDTLTVTEAVDWLYGQDILDVDGDSDVTESRQDMGDPLHSRPVTIIYGGTAAQPDINDGAVFINTNDGFLQAIDPVTGQELWSFIPANLLARTKLLATNPAADSDKFTAGGTGYGLDGNIRLVRTDVNGNGIVEPADGDKLFLYFGQRRGGDWYYGVDVTNKSAPQLMWSINSSSLPGMGQSWSMPTAAKVRIGATDTPVLFFGGGHNPGVSSAVPNQDGQPFLSDPIGNRLFMVNALTGALLWRAGPPSDAGADLKLAAMTNAIVADVRAIDLTGDGRADRLYAADLGGRLWRFDIFNGQPLVGTEGSRLIEGGVLASVGNAEDVVKDQTNTLRFFYAPDPSLITLEGQTFINIAIGSGHREMPNSDKITTNWFFSVRDYRVFAKLLSSQYQSICPSPAIAPCHQIVLEGDLVDLTTTVGDAATAAVPLGSPGWRFRLGTPGVGEKALAEARTFQGDIFFTTYAPEARTVTGGACGVSFGRNRLYVVSARDARPANNNDGSDTETTGDRSKELQQGSIAPEVVFIFPSPDDPTNCVGPECRPAPFCLVGLESCGPGFSNAPIRTFWRQTGTE